MSWKGKGSSPVTKPNLGLKLRLCLNFSILSLELSDTLFDITCQFRRPHCKRAALYLNLMQAPLIIIPTYLGFSTLVFSIFLYILKFKPVEQTDGHTQKMTFLSRREIGFTSFLIIMTGIIHCAYLCNMGILVFRGLNTNLFVTSKIELSNSRI